MFCLSHNNFFATMANETNQLLIQSLKDSNKSVNELCTATGLEQSKVSHALKRLTVCRFVQVKQEGRQRIYSLNKETILPILRLVDLHANKMCPTCQQLKERTPIKQEVCVCN